MLFGLYVVRWSAPGNGMISGYIDPDTDTEKLRSKLIAEEKARSQELLQIPDPTPVPTNIPQDETSEPEPEVVAMVVQQERRKQPTGESAAEMESDLSETEEVDVGDQLNTTEEREVLGESRLDLTLVLEEIDVADSELKQSFQALIERTQQLSTNNTAPPALPTSEKRTVVSPGEEHTRRRRTSSARTSDDQNDDENMVQ